MPSEYNVIHEEGTTDLQQQQAKLCSQCQLSVDTDFVFLPDAGAIVCAGCQSQFPAFPGRQSPPARQPSLCPAFEVPATPASPVRQGSFHPVDIEPHSSIPLVSDSNFSCYSPILSYPTKQPSFDIPPRHSSHSHSLYDIPRSHPFITPSPLTDITRLRVRSQGNHCLYPGAVFEGTQKSGRSSYDVNVTIVDVDFASSFLCGYLRIRGLTDDWPELTTYFDAEIIGSRHGFLTQNWGATEEEDLVHWQRFPAFKHVKHELKKPYLTINDRDRGAVFMRWKERFLVPNHRVQDIIGASFAGFYYVCVDFNPTSSSKSCEMPLTPEHEEPATTLPSASSLKQESPRRTRRNSSTRRRGRSPSAGPRHGPPVASMSGFYFHQNSEPYQQLSLSHVQERASSSFEFR